MTEEAWKIYRIKVNLQQKDIKNEMYCSSLLGLNTEMFPRTAFLSVKQFYKTLTVKYNRGFNSARFISQETNMETDFCMQQSHSTPH